ncbi:hypothetical protein HNQ60_004584 [Povalibacter uvarum]|uniref:Uncharacterized protein n=1 Tax=Povalibacter uvarum TaxID=732238 RepID=A0A841HSE3_9GAMM|nr:hypothetical protein [Povalibacter uvarum]
MANLPAIVVTYRTIGRKALTSAEQTGLDWLMFL